MPSGISSMDWTSTTSRYYYGKVPNELTFGFYRLNTYIKKSEFAIAVEEPLDELRIKVAKWLS